MSSPYPTIASLWEMLIFINDTLSRIINKDQQVLAEHPMFLVLYLSQEKGKRLDNHHKLEDLVAFVLAQDENNLERLILTPSNDLQGASRNAFQVFFAQLIIVNTHHTASP